MSKNERSFQNYFMTLARPLNFYRTALATGSGYPDITGFHGDSHSLVELKDIELGPTGNKLMKQMFQKTQPRWYMEYLSKGGKRLFIAFRIRDNQDRKYYGLWHPSIFEIKELAANNLTFKDVCASEYYRQYLVCVDMIEEIER